MGVLTKSAQMILRTVDPELSIDGVWGPKTDAAFRRADPITQGRVYEVYRNRGKVAPNQDRWISKENAEAIVAQQAERLGMAAYTEALKRFLGLEAQIRRSGGQVWYNVNSRNGKSVGLMQMQAGAWEAARKVDPTLPPYANGVYNPEANIAAGIAYARLNQAYIRKAGKPVNADNLYLAHNQGPGMFAVKGDPSKGYVTNFDGQSEAVRRMIAAAFKGRTPVFVPVRGELRNATWGSFA